MAEPVAPERGGESVPQLPDKGRPAQTAIGRAFAGLTLFGSLLLIVGPLLPWVQYWDNSVGWVNVNAPFIANGGPSDAVYSLGIGFFGACVGGVRLAITIPQLLRVAQILLGLWMAWGAAVDWSAALDSGSAPAAGLLMAQAGSIILVVGAFPIVFRWPTGTGLPQMPAVDADRRNQRAAVFAMVATFGGLLMVVGSFLPWAIVYAPNGTSTSESGIYASEGSLGDGVTTLICGIVAACLGATRFLMPLRLLLQRLPAVLGGVAAVVAVVDVIVAQGDRSYEEGPGHYVVFIAAIVTIVGCVVPSTSPQANERTGSWLAKNLESVSSVALAILGIATVIPPPATVAVLLGLTAVLLGYEALSGSSADQRGKVIAVAGSFLGIWSVIHAAILMVHAKIS